MSAGNLHIRDSRESRAHFRVHEKRRVSDRYELLRGTRLYAYHYGVFRPVVQPSHTPSRATNDDVIA